MPAGLNATIQINEKLKYVTHCAPQLLFLAQRVQACLSISSSLFPPGDTRPRDLLYSVTAWYCRASQTSLMSLIQCLPESWNRRMIKSAVIVYLDHNKGLLLHAACRQQNAQSIESLDYKCLKC